MNLDNSRQVTVANGDVTGTEFLVPGDHPGERPFDLNNNRAQEWNWYIHIDNGFDADIDVTIQGSHSNDDATNDTLDSPTVDGATETISSGTIDFFNGTTLHSYIQLNIDPLADPTSGELVVTFEARRE